MGTNKQQGGEQLRQRRAGGQKTRVTGLQGGKKHRCIEVAGVWTIKITEKQ
jgi:hypothetical protein